MLGNLRTYDESLLRTENVCLGGKNMSLKPLMTFKLKIKMYGPQGHILAGLGA